MNPRRSFFAAILAAIAATLLEGKAAQASGPAADAFASLLQGLPTLHGCRIAGVYPLVVGAIPIVLDGPDGLFQVDICRRSSSPRGVAQSSSFDLFVHNGGKGNKPTTRTQILALRALARELDVLEERAFFASELLTWEKRQLEAGTCSLSVLPTTGQPQCAG